MRNDLDGSHIYPDPQQLERFKLGSSSLSRFRERRLFRATIATDRMSVVRGALSPSRHLYHSTVFLERF